MSSFRPYQMHTFQCERNLKDQIVATAPEALARTLGSQLPPRPGSSLPPIGGSADDEVSSITRGGGTPSAFRAVSSKVKIAPLSVQIPASPPVAAQSSPTFNTNPNVTPSVRAVLDAMSPALRLRAAHPSPSATTSAPSFGVTEASASKALASYQLPDGRVSPMVHQQPHLLSVTGPTGTGEPMVVARPSQLPASAVAESRYSSQSVMAAASPMLRGSRAPSPFPVGDGNGEKFPGGPHSPVLASTQSPAIASMSTAATLRSASPIPLALTPSLAELGTNTIPLSFAISAQPMSPLTAPSPQNSSVLQHSKNAFDFPQQAARAASPPIYHTNVSPTSVQQSTSPVSRQPSPILTRPHTSLSQILPSTATNTDFSVVPRPEPSNTAIFASTADSYSFVGLPTPNPLSSLITDPAPCAVTLKSKRPIWNKLPYDRFSRPLVRLSQQTSTEDESNEDVYIASASAPTLQLTAGSVTLSRTATTPKAPVTRETELVLRSDADRRASQRGTLLTQAPWTGVPTPLTTFRPPETPNGSQWQRTYPTQQQQQQQVMRTVENTVAVADAGPGFGLQRSSSQRTLSGAVTPTASFGDSRPASRPGTGNGSRPGTGNGSRPGTGNGSRPGTGSGSRPGSRGGVQGGTLDNTKLFEAIANHSSTVSVSASVVGPAPMPYTSTNILRPSSSASNNFYHFRDDNALQPPLRPHTREKQQLQHNASMTSLSNRSLFNATGNMSRSMSSRELRGPQMQATQPTASFGGYTILGGGNVSTTGIQQPPMCFTSQSSMAPFSPNSATFSVTNLPHSHAGVSLLKMHALPQAPVNGATGSSVHRQIEQQSGKHALFQQLAIDLAQQMQCLPHYQLLTYYDSYSYIDPSTGRMPLPDAKMGSLPLIYLHYSKYATASTSSLTSADSFDGIAKRNRSLSVDEVLAFCREMNLVPDYLDTGDVYMLYSKAFKGHSADEHVALMGYPEFVEFLARAANLGFSRTPERKQQYPTSASRVRALAQFLGLDDVDAIKKRLEALAHARLHPANLTRRGAATGQRHSDFLRKNTGSIKLGRYMNDQPVPFDADCVFELKQYDVSFQKNNWVSYGGQFIDCGTVTASSRHRFRLTVRNSSVQTVKLLFSFAEMPFVKAQYLQTPLISGFSRHAEFWVAEDAPVGEHVFFIHVTAAPHSDTHTACMSTAENVLSGHAEVLALRVPVYMRVVDPTASIDGELTLAQDWNADALPPRQMPGVEHTLDPVSPRLRSTYHPNSVHLTYLVSAIERSELRDEQQRRQRLMEQCPTREEMYLMLNPPEPDDELQKKLAARVSANQNSDDNQEKVVEKPIETKENADEGVDDVDEERRACQVLTRLLVGNVYEEHAGPQSSSPPPLSVAAQHEAGQKYAFTTSMRASLPPRSSPTRSAGGAPWINRNSASSPESPPPRASTVAALAEYSTSMSSITSLQSSLKSEKPEKQDDYARTFSKLDAGAKLARTAELKPETGSRALRMSPSASMMASAMDSSQGDHDEPNAVRFGDVLPSKLAASIVQRTYSSANFAAFPIVRS